MRNYRKLWVAIAGVVLIGAKELLDIELGVTPDALYDGVVAALVAVGVLTARNTKIRRPT